MKTFIIAAALILTPGLAVAQMAGGTAASTSAGANPATGATAGGAAGRGASGAGMAGAGMTPGMGQTTTATGAIGTPAGSGIATDGSVNGMLPPTGGAAADRSRATSPATRNTRRPGAMGRTNGTGTRASTTTDTRSSVTPPRN